MMLCRCAVLPLRPQRPLRSLLPQQPAGRNDVHHMQQAGTHQLSMQDKYHHTTTPLHHCITVSPHTVKAPAAQTQRTTLACHTCGRIGHIARECRKQFAAPQYAAQQGTCYTWYILLSHFLILICYLFITAEEWATLRESAQPRDQT